MPFSFAGTRFETIVLDVSGVITDARMIFVDKLHICMEYSGLWEKNISFAELVDAFQYEKKGLDELFDRKNVDPTKKDKFWDVWEKIPEYVHGHTPIFHGVRSVINKMCEKAEVIFACRLSETVYEAFYDDARLWGIKDGIPDFKPKNDVERFSKECMKTIFRRVIRATKEPRLFIDDSPGRIELFKKIAPDAFCVGSTQGIYNMDDFVRRQADKVICHLSEFV